MVFNCKLNVHQAAHRQRGREQTRVVTHRLDMFRINSDGRQDARRVARMYARLFDVFLNRGDDAGVFIRQRVHIKLGGTFEKLIDQDRPVGREANCSAHIFVKTLFVVNDGHRAAAQNITRSDQHRVTYLLGNSFRLFSGRGHSVFRLRDAQLA